MKVNSKIIVLLVLAFIHGQIKIHIKEVLLMEKCDYFTSGQFFASLARSAMGRPNRLIKPFASN